MTTEPPIGEDDLQAWVDGRLPPGRHGLVARWLEEHPAEVARLTAYAKQAGELRAALAPVVEEPIPARLRPRHVREVRRARWAKRIRHAAAAMLLLGASGLGGYVMQSTRRTDTQSFAEVGPGAWPVAIWAGGLRDPASELSTQLGEDVALPDLSRHGFQLQEAWALPGAAILLVYTDHTDTRLSFFRRSAEAGEGPAALRCQDGPGGWLTYHWSDGHHVYALSAAVTRERLRPIALDTEEQMRAPPRARNQLMARTPSRPCLA